MVTSKAKRQGKKVLRYGNSGHTHESREQHRHSGASTRYLIEAPEVIESVAQAKDIYQAVKPVYRDAVAHEVVVLGATPDQRRRIKRKMRMKRKRHLKRIHFKFISAGDPTASAVTEAALKKCGLAMPSPFVAERARAYERMQKRHYTAEQTVTTDAILSSLNGPSL